MERRLKYCPYGKCYAKVDEYGGVTLVSYATEVITIDPQGWLTCSGTYSATTRKHIGAFMKEYAPNIVGGYHIAKSAYLANLSFNIYTGEVVEL